ncbi:MAG: aldehyde dehydrogenase family protein, partial [Bacteroidota bacterium]|nr:aldehyde dehydrogenase family protein [Bacteroidota bacterium]
MSPAVSMPPAAPQAATAVAANPFQAQFEALRQRAPLLRSEGVRERRARLGKLTDWLHAHRTDIQQALLTDFRKPTAETDLTE